MANISLEDAILPQEEIEVDGVTYLVTALPATKGLQFLEKHQNSLDETKVDLSIMKEVICNNVSKNGKVIKDSDKPGNGILSFDIVFARKMGHVRNLYFAVVQYNFGDVFQEPDSEE